MQPSYILTEQEYNDLLSSGPNVFLEHRVEELEIENQKYKMYKRNMELDSDRLAEAVAQSEPDDLVWTIYPFEIKDGVLYITEEYFITMYNSLACKSLGGSDRNILIALAQLAGSLGTALQFSMQADVKKYRVSLQKQKICKATKIKGVTQLIRV